ncbi:MAG: rhomboid family intramembrane serine protease [Cyclobacteriaceae bacterium]
MTGILDDFKNAWDKPNNALPQLIIINVAVFVVTAIIYVVGTIAGFEGMVDAIFHGIFFIPPVFSDFLMKPWTIMTYAFAHDLRGIFHILFNMLMLYWFGRLIVDYLGSDRLIKLYVLGALAGAALYLLLFNLLPFYQEQASRISGMIGASAAVYAVIVAAATLMPNHTFFLLFFGPVKIKYIAAFSIFVSFLGSVGSNSGGNVAHLGGALIGYYYIATLNKGGDIGAWIISFMNWVKSFFVPRSKIKVTYSRKEKSTSRSSSKSATNASQDEIDVILDKISESGYESLSSDEKQKLFNASKK